MSQLRIIDLRQPPEPKKLNRDSWFLTAGAPLPGPPGGSPPPGKGKGGGGGGGGKGPGGGGGVDKGKKKDVWEGMVPVTAEQWLAALPDIIIRPSVAAWLGDIVYEVSQFLPPMVKAPEMPDPNAPPIGFSQPHLPAVLLPEFQINISAGLIPWDHGLPTVARRHEQQVAEILNSLILQGKLVRATDEKTWEMAYTPTDIQAWAPGAPETLVEALDRLADLIKTLNGGLGA